MRRFYCLILTLFVLSPWALGADTLYKKNGDVLRNVKIVGQSRMQVRYKKQGEEKTRYIAKSQLRRIVYGSVDKDEEEKKRRKEREERKKREEAARKKRELARKRAAAARRRQAALAEQQKLKEAIRRDIVLPGWGQWHLGQRGKGAAFAGAYLATAAYAASSFQNVQAATANYLDPLPFLMFQSSDNGLVLGNLIYGQRGAEVEAAAGQLNQSLLLLTLIWAGGFLDLSFYQGRAAPPARRSTAPRRRAPSKGGGPPRSGGSSKGGGPPSTHRSGVRTGFYALPPLTTRQNDRGSFGFVVQMRF